jgi:tRNA(Ile)-lysidine synthase
MDAFAAGGAWPGAVAVSGGGDSVALMHLLARWAKKAKATPPTILIVDHGLRTESKKEAAATARRARALGLSATVLRWERGGRAKGGLEAAAREARYRLMGGAMRRKKLTTLHLGHSQDDQAETFLLRLARGSGLDGLSAMRPLAPFPHPDFPELSLARPLLDFSRAELRGFLSASGEAWLEDPMNDDPRFDRVRMRKAAPALAEAGLSPGRIALAARHIASGRDLLAGLAMALQERVSRAVKGGILVDQDALGGAPRELGLRVLAALLQAISGAPYRPRFESLERLFDRLAGTSLGGGATLGGCRIGPAPAKERLFGAQTLKITRESGRKGSV